MVSLEFYASRIESLRPHAQRFSEWVLDESQWRWARTLGHIVLLAFTVHPEETRETYFQHLWFTTKTSLRFLALSLLLFMHGVFPFLFTRTASIQIERIYMLMRSRIPQARRSILEDGYEI